MLLFVCIQCWLVPTAPCPRRVQQKILVWKLFIFSFSSFRCQCCCRELVEHPINELTLLASIVSVAMDVEWDNESFIHMPFRCMGNGCGNVWNGLSVNGNNRSVTPCSSTRSRVVPLLETQNSLKPTATRVSVASPYFIVCLWFLPP